MKNIILILGLGFSINNFTYAASSCQETFASSAKDVDKMEKTLHLSIEKGNISDFNEIIKELDADEIDIKVLLQAFVFYNQTKMLRDLLESDSSMISPYAKLLMRKASFERDAESQLQLGYMYLNDKNFLEANEWFRRAAYLGHPIAQYRFGRFHMYEKNYNEAKYWLEKAAIKHIQDAQYYLGTIHFKAKEYSDAEFWLIKAASQDYVEAQLLVGIIFHNEKDHKSAIVWFKKLLKMETLMLNVGYLCCWRASREKFNSKVTRSVF